MNMKRFGLVKAVLALGMALVIGGVAVADVKVRLRSGSDFVVDVRGDTAGTPKFSVNRTGGPRLPLVTEADRDNLTGTETGECVWNTSDNELNCVGNDGLWDEVGTPSIHAVAPSDTGLLYTCGGYTRMLYKTAQYNSATCEDGYEQKSRSQLITMLRETNCSFADLMYSVDGCDLGLDDSGVTMWKNYAGGCESSTSRIYLRASDGYLWLAKGTTATSPVKITSYATNGSWLWGLCYAE